MKKYGQTFFRTSFSLALAAAVAVSAAGCGGTAHTSSAPSAAPQASTESAAATLTSDSSAAAAAADTAAETAAETADTAAAADTAATTAAAEIAATDETAAAAQTGETASAAETAETASTDATAAAAAEPSNAAEAMEDGVPERDKPDTALQESVLSEALVECTGWGQSAGSSLRAATAAVKMLMWANQAEAGSADSDALSEAVGAEVKRLTDAQKENLKTNWSAVSFDASMILDSYDEVAPILEDAGCADAAKEAAENKDVLANWEALEHALDAALE